MFRTVLILIYAIILIQGCSASSVKEEGPADVTSNPSGATVYANGEELGITPLHYELYKAFPAGWKNMMFQAQGVLMVKMDGCEDYILNVNDYLLSKPVHVELQCDEASKAKQSAPAEPVMNKSSAEQVILPRNEVEARLKELESLYEKGVIKKDEYNAIRERILNDL